METGTPEFARTPKAGLLRAVPAAGEAGRGTQAPGEGFALTIAARECAKLSFLHEQDRHNVALGVGLVAAKRASLIGRGPQLSDVQVALELFGLSGESIVDDTLSAPFRGLAHSYVLQRRFVDAVDADALVAPGNAVPL
jgi:hypothetical protein